jgi:hypothetical protein
MGGSHGSPYHSDAVPVWKHVLLRHLQSFYPKKEPQFASQALETAHSPWVAAARDAACVWYW